MKKTLMITPLEALEALMELEGLIPGMNANQLKRLFSNRRYLILKDLDAEEAFCLLQERARKGATLRERIDTNFLVDMEMAKAMVEYGSDIGLPTVYSEGIPANRSLSTTVIRLEWDDAKRVTLEILDEIFILEEY